MAKAISNDELVETMRVSLERHGSFIEIVSHEIPKAGELCITLETYYSTDRKKPLPISRWYIKFSEVADWRILNSTLKYPFWMPELTSRHPLVIQHDKQKVLHFSGRKVPPLEVLGALYKAHDTATKGWIPFLKFLNCNNSLQHFEKLLSYSSGVLATGPEVLLEAYRAALIQLGCSAQIKDSEIASSRTEPNTYVALVIKDSYFVAETLTSTLDESEK